MARGTTGALRLYSAPAAYDGAGGHHWHAACSVAVRGSVDPPRASVARTRSPRSSSEHVASVRLPHDVEGDGGSGGVRRHLAERSLPHRDRRLRRHAVDAIRTHSGAAGASRLIVVPGFFELPIEWGTKVYNGASSLVPSWSESLTLSESESESGSESE
jgi:hypothetical protein